MAIRNYDIGGMLARSGQAQGQQMAQGVSAFGQGLGNMLTSGVEAFRKSRDATELQQLLKANQADPAALEQLAQSYDAKGETEAAATVRRAATFAKEQQIRTSLQDLDMTDATSMMAIGRDIMAVDTEAGLGLVTKGAAMQQAKAKGARMAENLKSIFGADNPTVSALAQELSSITTPEGLEAIRPAYVEQMIKRIPKTGPEARYAIAKGFVPNLTKEKFNEIGLAGFSEDSFDKWMAGQEGGDIAAWQYKDEEGNLGIKAFRTGNGLVYVEGQWVTPEDAGLIQEAPESQIISQAASSFEDEIIKKNAENFFDLHQQARESSSALANLDEVIGMIDTMPTGAFADTKANLIRYFKQIGLDLSDLGNIEDYQTFEAAAGRRVASYIKTLGSGNGITDKDLEFTLKVVGASASLEPGSLKRILEEFRQGNINKIKDYNNIRTKTASALDKRSTGSSELSMSSFQLIPLPSTGLVVGTPVPVNEES